MWTRATVSDKNFCTQCMCSVCEQDVLGNRERKCQSADLALFCTSSFVIPSQIFKGVFTDSLSHALRVRVTQTSHGLRQATNWAGSGILVGLTLTLLHFGPTGHHFNLRIAAEVKPGQSDIKQQASHALARYQVVFHPNKSS